MPRGRRGVHVDVSVHGGGHHHGHGHHHHHHHGGAGKVVAAGLVGAAAGAAVASKSNNKSQPPPKQGTTVVVVQQPSQPPPQQYQPPPQQYQPPPQQYQPPPQQYQPPPQQYQPPPQHHQGPPPGASVTVAHQGPGGNTQVVHVETQGGQGPKRATVLGKRFKNGNTVFLHSLNSKEHVRSKRLGRKLDASGGNKEYSQWVVERVGVDRVKFRNVGHNSSYLRIQSPNQADDLGEGGVHCEFWVAKHGRYGGSDRVYSFESVAHPGNFLGFTPKGDVKAPKDTGLGPAGQFHVRVHKWS